MTSDEQFYLKKAFSYLGGFRSWPDNLTMILSIKDKIAFVNRKKLKFEFHFVDIQTHNSIYTFKKECIETIAGEFQKEKMQLSKLENYEKIIQSQNDERLRLVYANNIATIHLKDVEFDIRLDIEAFNNEIILRLTEKKQ
jgi:hypothetical protein